MNKFIKLFCLIVYLIISFNVSKSQNLKPYEFSRGDIRIMFYNVENLFDIFNDSLKNDDEFIPNGQRFWTKRRYNEKLTNISKICAGIGQWELPEIIGLCEIENRSVLEDLIFKTDMKKFNYGIIHKESPDLRGIDVGFLYRKEKFFPIEYDAISVNFPFDHRPTRDILYVKGTSLFNDTLHLFINHWPSRWGGQSDTDRKRVYTAEVLKLKVDSIFNVDQAPKIIIMGDLNDYPENKSLLTALKAQIDFSSIEDEQLYNLAYYLQENKNKGTHKHEGHWGVLDQIIVSGSLLKSNSNINMTVEDVHVFDAPYLLEEDIHFFGKTTYRTYIGYKYHGGYSDHLPVYIDLNKKENNAK